MKYVYLLVDFFTIIVPLIFSFHPRLNFYKTWRAFFPAVVITGICFIVWDIYFVNLGVWGFNPEYVVGLTIGNLPVEEVLFFLCIPYACVFTFHCLNILVRQSFSEKVERKLTILFIITFLIIGIINYQKLYPAFTFISLAILLTLAKFYFHIKWLNRFYMIYAILLLPFLIVNGVLTGTGLENPVVWYNETEILGPRILTIPVEDVFYGMELILMNLILYHYFSEKVYSKKILSRV